jgi:hypothetical protein
MEMGRQRRTITEGGASPRSFCSGKISGAGPGGRRQVPLPVKRGVERRHADDEERSDRKPYSWRQKCIRIGRFSSTEKMC